MSSCDTIQSALLGDDICKGWNNHYFTLTEYQYVQPLVDAVVTGHIFIIIDMIYLSLSNTLYIQYNWRLIHCILNLPNQSDRLYLWYTTFTFLLKVPFTGTVQFGCLASHDWDRHVTPRWTGACCTGLLETLIMSIFLPFDVCNNNIMLVWYHFHILS